MTQHTVDAINWNQIEDDKDLEIWNRLVRNFWLPEKVPLSNDIPSWNTLTDAEKLLTVRVFTGLTHLDTIQSKVGAVELIKDAVTPHEEAVYANIAFMEAFAAGTQLLTPTGWKDISLITKSDKVIQYNPETKGLEFVSPLATMSHFNDEVYRISTKNGRGLQVVSANHRVHYEERDKKINRSLKWSDKETTAADLFNGVVNMASGHRRLRETGWSDMRGNGLTSEERLLIAIQADGSYDTTTLNPEGGYRRSGIKTGTVPVRFSFSKPRKIERLKRLSITAGWTLKESKEMRVGDGPNVNPRLELRLMVPVEYVDRSKNFWTMFSGRLESMSQHCANEFIEELSYWDCYRNEETGAVMYTTASKANADFVAAVAALGGRRTSCRKIVDDRSETYSDTYQMNILRESNTISMQNIIVQKTEPQQVYCIQVPSTFLLTRHVEGKGTIISGNCVHAKSYSSIFSTLCSSQTINDAFRWARENPHLQRKADVILGHYYADDPLKKKIVSVFLESFLFYSGFYLPFYWASHAKLTNTADLIRLIVRDEACHGYYVGYKFQLAFRKETQERQDDIRNFAYEVLMELYDNEILYTASLYDDVGLTEDVKKFLHYNANKALMNLGFEPLFPKTVTDVDPSILASLSPSADENHDFFSGSGSSYVIGKAVSTEDDDWAF